MSLWLSNRVNLCVYVSTTTMCHQLRMSVEIPGLDEGAPELTQHSGLTVPEGRLPGHGTQARDSPLLRSDPSRIPYYVFTCIHVYVIMHVGTCKNYMYIYTYTQCSYCTCTIIHVNTCRCTIILLCVLLYYYVDILLYM